MPGLRGDVSAAPTTTTATLIGVVPFFAMKKYYAFGWRKRAIVTKAEIRSSFLLKGILIFYSTKQINCLRSIIYVANFIFG
ncbi:hypothetical protein MPC4_20101 [Methylocella tundrae]|uniref:Uncharacterized protein n=1 Tax=Methylocella tundrae TaxID=227605 RepID=A0A8B6M4F1_METTU|nr:hypothetical protein MPC4_20101 [Methylocella tundrae]